MQKELVRVLKDTAVDWYGIDAPPIEEALPVNLPQVTAREPLVDAVFRTQDSHLLHLEFQSSPAPKLLRFLAYATALVVEHEAPVKVVVIHLHAGPPPPRHFDAESIQFTVENVVVGARDGVPVWEHLQERMAHPNEWTPADLMDLAYAPFMRHPTLTESERARAAADMALRLPAQPGLSAVALVMGLAAGFLQPPDVKYVMEVLRMSPVLRDLEREARQVGRQEGRFLLAEALLMRRFGPLPAAVRSSLAALSDTDLESVTLRLLSADSLATVQAILADF